MESQVGVVLSPHLPTLHSSPLQAGKSGLNSCSSHPTPPRAQIRFLAVLSFPHSEDLLPPQSAVSACLLPFPPAPGRVGVEAARPSQASPTLALLPPERRALRRCTSGQRGPGHRPRTPRAPSVEWRVGDGNVSGARLPSRHCETPILLARLGPRLLSLRSLETRREGSLRPRPRLRPPCRRQGPALLPRLLPRPTGFPQATVLCAVSICV